MKLEAFDQFRGVTLDVGVVLYFAGEFTPAVTAALADALRRRLESRGVEPALRRRLFSTFVELTQNVLHYAAPTPPTSSGPGGQAESAAARRRGAVGLGQAGSGYWVVCANQVPLELAARLEAKLAELRGLSPQALRQAYRRQLADDEHETKDPLSRGAGLGLITIARAADGPLEHHLTPDPDSGGRLATFHLCVRLAPTPPTRSPP